MCAFWTKLVAVSDILLYFYPINYDSGEISSFSDEKSVLESFKENNYKNIKLKNLNFGQNYGKSFKFKGFY